MKFEWDINWFYMGMFVMWMTHLFAWAMGDQIEPTWAINTMPIWLGVAWNLLDNFALPKLNEGEKDG